MAVAKWADGNRNPLKPTNSISSTWLANSLSSVPVLDIDSCADSGPWSTKPTDRIRCPQRMQIFLDGHLVHQDASVVCGRWDVSPRRLKSHPVENLRLEAGVLLDVVFVQLHDTPRW